MLCTENIQFINETSDEILLETLLVAFIVYHLTRYLITCL